MTAAAHPEGGRQNSLRPSRSCPCLITKTKYLQPLKTSKSFELIPPDMSEHGTEGAGSTTMKSKPRRHLNLVLCGRRGAGKTSAAKVILGQTELQWVSSSSECVRNQGEVCGRWLSLVELPALYGKAPQEVMEESFRCVSLCDPEGVHAFLLVLPVGPLTDEDKGELQTIQDTFSSEVDDFTMILFTVDSDPTAPAVVKSVERDRDIQELLESCGGRSVVLNIRNQQQVPDLLEKVETMSAEGSRCFSTRISSRAFSEKVSKLLADLQAERQKNEAGDVQREHLLKELQRERKEREETEESLKKKHKETLKTLKAQSEHERKEKIQKLKEKDETMEKERVNKKRERDEEEKKRKKQEEAQRHEWKLKLEAAERKSQLEKERKENTEKKLEQLRREVKRDRDVWEKEKIQIWEQRYQELKQNLEETKRSAEEEKPRSTRLQEELYQKRRKWSYAWFALLFFVIFVLIYVYHSLPHREL